MPEKTDWYEVAHVDGAVVASLHGNGYTSFWHQACTSVIRWMKEACELAGRCEPDLNVIVEAIGDDARLGEFIEATARSAATRGRAEGNDLQRWYHEEWMRLETPLRRNIVATLRNAAESDVTVASREGPERGQPVPIGKRVGAWRGWDTASLPETARDAADKAMREVEKGRGIAVAATRRNDPQQPGEIEEGRRRAVAPTSRTDTQQPGESGLRLLATGIAHTVQATEDVRQAAVQLGRAAAAGATHRQQRHTKRLLKSARDNVVTLLETLLTSTIGIVEAEEKARHNAGGRLTGENAENAARPRRYASRQGAKARPAHPDADRPLAGLRISFTGRMSEPQSVLIGKAMQAGAAWSSTPSRQTAFMVVGAVRNRNAKGLRNARRLGIELIDEAEFNRRAARPSPERAAAPAEDDAVTA